MSKRRKKIAEKKLLVCAFMFLVFALVFALIAVYLEAKTGIVKEELLLEHLKGNPQAVTIETFGTVSNWVMQFSKVLCVTCLVCFLVNIARLIKNKFLAGGKR